MSALVAATAIRGASGGVATAAALGVALAQPARSVVLCELGNATQRRPTLLCSPAARLLEQRLAGLAADDDSVHTIAARGTLCWVALGAAPSWREALDSCLDVGADAVVVSLEPPLWRELLDSGPGSPAGAILRADVPRGRGLAALLAGELCARGLRVGIVTSAPGLVATRRALAGIDPGGELARRTGRIAARIRLRAGGASA